jgi:hypothetical protein
MQEVRGPYHERLAAWLRSCIAGGDYTQESVAHVAGMHQTTLGGIIRPENPKGTLDLDEAAAALEHCGWSLEGFVAQTSPQARKLTPLDAIVKGLKNRPELMPLVTALLGVPRKQHALVRDAVLMAVHAATGPRATQTSERTPAATPVRRTRSGRGPSQ